MRKRHKDLTALILCGGKGERLRPLTEDLPKPLIPVKGRPILDYIINHILGYEVGRLLVATGYRSEKIADYFESHHTGLDVRLVDSGEADIIQRMKDAAAHIEGEFLMFYGDTLSDVDLDSLASFHRSHDGMATVTVWPMRSPFGVLEFGAKETIESFREKPILDKWINIGYFHFDREVLDRAAAFSRFEDLLQDLIKSRQLYGFRHKGLHITVNTQQELLEAEDSIDVFSRRGTR